MVLTILTDRNLGLGNPMGLGSLISAGVIGVVGRTKGGGEGKLSLWVSVSAGISPLFPADAVRKELRGDVVAGPSKCGGRLIVGCVSML